MTLCSDTITSQAACPLSNSNGNRLASTMIHTKAMKSAFVREEKLQTRPVSCYISSASRLQVQSHARWRYPTPASIIVMPLSYTLYTKTKKFRPIQLTNLFNALGCAPRRRRRPPPRHPPPPAAGPRPSAAAAAAAVATYALGVGVGVRLTLCHAVFVRRKILCRHSERGWGRRRGSLFKTLLTSLPTTRLCQPP